MNESQISIVNCDVNVQTNLFIIDFLNVTDTVSAEHLPVLRVSSQPSRIELAGCWLLGQLISIT